MPGIVCAKCGFTTLYENEKPVFCAKCANRFLGEGDYHSELKKAVSLDSYQDRYAHLMRLRAAHPDTYEIELEILLLGRLHEKGGKPDFYRIPFWPLAAYETPGEYSKKERSKMLTSFFESEAVQRVKALAGTEEDFWNDYLFRMGKSYVELFIKGSNANSTFLGFRRRPDDVQRRCANSLANMLANIDKSGYPSEEIRKNLICRLKTAFVCVFDTDEAKSVLEKALGK